MIQPDTTFGAMTARPTSRSHTEATKGNPSRVKRSWPARLGEGDLWTIALRYAMGHKTIAIAADYQVSTGFVSITARAHGLTLRGNASCRCRQPNPADEAHLRRWARRKADEYARRAYAWTALATLE